LPDEVRGKRKWGWVNRKGRYHQDKIVVVNTCSSNLKKGAKRARCGFPRAKRGGEGTEGGREVTLEFSHPWWQWGRGEGSWHQRCGGRRGP